ncbi:MAG: diguanylate cyclase [Rhizobiaceae bacterium]|nr:diguanylate cyclase [Rhizobiaceae bacterium]
MSQKTSRKSVLGLSSWLRFGIGIAFAAILAGTVAMETELRESSLRSAEERTAMLATTLAQQAADTFQIADLALSSLGRLIGEDTPTTNELALLRLDMTELLRRVPRISSLSYYEQSGWRLATSESEALESASNQARADFFRHHRKHPGNDLYIGPPIRIEASGEWVVTASRRVVHPDGSFDGVLLATMRSTYFADVYSALKTDKQSRIIILSPSAKLMARSPHDDALIGIDVSDNIIPRLIREGATSGSTRQFSPIDGAEVISSFHRLPGRLVAVIYSMTLEAATAPWREGLPYRLLVAGAFLTLVVVGGSRLVRYARARQISELNLLAISRTDALTGLLNRRSFDETLPIEWMRCVASGHPLSLLMIDVDHFKAFNDTYGHQAGDVCLKAIAAAISSAARRPRDRVMRYGGEEMIALLPETPPREAARVAERMRAGIEVLRIPHAASPLGFVTISIGFSTEDRSTAPRSSASDLLADADRALYAAKASGRNRSLASDRPAQLLSAAAYG